MMLIALLLYAIGSFIKFLFRMFVMLVGIICICLSSFDIVMIIRLILKGVEIDNLVLNLFVCFIILISGICCFASLLIKRNKTQ